MGIMSPAPPPEVEAAFLRGLPAFLPGSATDRELVQKFVGKPHVLPTLEEIGFTNEKVRHTATQQVFVLNAVDVARHASPAAAIPAGWRFFAGREPPATIQGRLSFRPPGRWKLTGVSCGEPVWRVLHASYALDELDPVRGGGFELRVLMMPALGVEGYWLASLDRGREDLLAPFPGRREHPCARRWSEPVYPLAEFLAALRPNARLQSRVRPRHAEVLEPAPATVP